jgi:thioredoxin reductase (NADPH)
MGRFRRKCLLVDGGASRASWIPVSHNILGFAEGVSGPDLLRILLKQAEHYGVVPAQGEISSLELLPNGLFRARWHKGEVKSRKVLMATGGLDVEPEIPNARALVKDGLIRHCPICDAFEATGKRIALVAYGKCRIKEALLIRGYTSDLTVLTLGNASQIAPADMRVLSDAGIQIVLQPIVRLTREGEKIAAWSSQDGRPLLFDTIYSALGMQLRSDLAVSVGAEVDENGALLVDRHQQTAVPGLYAAGDIVHGLSQVSVAAGQAAIAATAINASLPPLRF